VIARELNVTDFAEEYEGLMMRGWPHDERVELPNLEIKTGLLLRRTKVGKMYDSPHLKGPRCHPLEVWEAV
jgi:hypothetical protein